MPRILITGCGHMGSLHLEMLQARGLAPFICDKNEVTKSGVCVSGDLCSFLDEVYDLAIIASPTSTHLEVFSELAPFAKRVLIEKPLASNLKECKEIEKISAKTGCEVFLGFCERFNPVVLKLRELLKEEKVIWARFLRSGPNPVRVQDVGVMHDLCIHDLDLIGFVFNDYLKEHSCFSQGLNVVGDEALIAGSGDALYSIQASWNDKNKKRQIEVFCKDASFFVDLLQGQIYKDKELIFAQSGSNALRLMHEELLGEIKYCALLEDGIRANAYLEEK